jgi:hypothetical protein
LKFQIEETASAGVLWNFGARPIDFTWGRVGNDVAVFTLAGGASPAPTAVHPEPALPGEESGGVGQKVGEHIGRQIPSPDI